MISLPSLNEFLKLKSYVVGYNATQMDIAVYESLKSDEVIGSSLVNLKRWYCHIKNIQAANMSIPGKKEIPKEITALGQKSSDENAADDFDLFGDDDEDDAATKAALAKEAEALKKPKKQVIDKSIIVLDVKPIDDETDLVAVEKMVRGIQMEGLEWMGSEFVDLCFGLKKLRISAEVIDSKVSTDDLEEMIQQFEDHVQSTDVVSFNKSN